MGGESKEACGEFQFHDSSNHDVHKCTSDLTISHIDGPKPQLVQRRKGPTFDALRTSGRSRLYPDLDETDEIESVVENYENASFSLEAQLPRSHSVIRLGGLAFRLIWFLFKSVVNISTSPLWTIYHIYMFVTDPFSIKKRIRDYVIRKVLKLWYPISRTVIHYVYERLKEQNIIWKLAKQLGWGVLWGLYVCSVMCVLLVIAVLVSWKVTHHVVVRPVSFMESLNFDYTMNSPVSVVPISGGLPLIPRNHKVQVGVTLTMPESDFNRKLGMFQVQVEALSTNGETLASMSHPCMLQYKSMPIQLVLTLLEMVPLVTGCRLESQTRHIKLGTYIEGALPTPSFKVVLEGRAEYPSGTVPEIYSAFIKVESRYVLLKKACIVPEAIFILVDRLYVFYSGAVCCATLFPIPRSPKIHITGS